MIKTHNSLTQKKEELKPITPGKIKLYVCGPTVYDFCHIGNARSFSAFDVIVRYLRFRGFDVTYVRNITDIDDKIISKAQQENKTELQITQYYTKAYFENLSNYNILKPTFLPQVTDYIPQIQKFISNLLYQNYAYQQKSNVLFRVKNNNLDYGRLSKQKIDKLKETEARQKYPRRQRPIPC